MPQTADQIREAIVHPYAPTRAMAVRYFAHSFSSDPEVMPKVIAAIQEYGWDEAFEWYSFLEDLRQSEPTMRWLLEQVREDAHDDRKLEARNENLWRALAYADIVLLQRLHQEVLELLPEEYAGIIRRRLDLPSRPAEELWQQLERFCDQLDEATEDEDDSPADTTHGELLVEALARHPEFCSDRVLEILAPESAYEGTWLEVMAVRLAGETRLEPVVGRLVAILDDEEDADEAMLAECSRALIKIGTAAVVDALVSSLDEWQFTRTQTAAEIFETIPAEHTIQACREFLKRDEPLDIKELWHTCLLRLFVPEAIEPARQFLLDPQVELEIVEIRNALLALATLVGASFPEMEAWKKRDANDTERRRRWQAEFGDVSADEFEDGVDDDDDYDQEVLDDDEYDDSAYEPPVANDVSTYIHDQDRVGRNNPCPCGSGKKFKKCCYRKDQGSIYNSLP